MEPITLGTWILIFICISQSAMFSGMNLAVFGELIPKLQLHNTVHGQSSIDRDIILVWTDRKRVITGTDLLDRLLKGTAT